MRPAQLLAALRSGGGAAMQPAGGVDPSGNEGATNGWHGAGAELADAAVAGFSGGEQAVPAEQLHQLQQQQEQQQQQQLGRDEAAADTEEAEWLSGQLWGRIFREDLTAESGAYALPYAILKVGAGVGASGL
jgi:hypothetical protein